MEIPTQKGEHSLMYRANVQSCLYQWKEGSGDLHNIHLYCLSCSPCVIEKWTFLLVSSLSSETFIYSIHLFESIINIYCELALRMYNNNFHTSDFLIDNITFTHVFKQYSLCNSIHDILLYFFLTLILFNSVTH